MDSMKALLLACLLVSCAASPPKWLKAAETAWYASGTSNSGTAVPIAAEPNDDCTWRVLFLTPAHVVADGAAFDLLLGGVLWGSATVYRVDLEADAALLLATLAERPSVPELRYDPLREGERVYHSGYGGGDEEERWISRGIAAGPNRATVYVTPGDSGAPIIDEDGRIAGYVVRLGALPHPHHQFIFGHVYLVPLAAIESWLKEAIEGLKSFSPGPVPSE